MERYIFIRGGGHVAVMTQCRDSLVAIETKKRDEACSSRGDFSLCTLTRRKNSNDTHMHHTRYQRWHSHDDKTRAMRQRPPVL